MTKALQAHIALLSGNIIFGANYIIAKGIMPDKIGPSGFVFLRVLGALLIFWAFYFLLVRNRPKSENSIGIGPEKVRKKDIWRVIACALTGVTINQLFFFNGLNLTSPINASIILTSNPIMVLVISAIILREYISTRRIFGVLIGAIGAVSLILLSKNDVAGNATVQGDMMVLINSASYAFYLVLAKPLMTRYHPLTIVSWIFTIGFFFIFPIGVSQFTSIAWDLFTSWDYFSVIYVIIGPTCLAYFLMMFALQHLPPTVTSSYIYLQPVMAGIFALILAKVIEEDYTSDITGLKVLCTVLIFIGVYLVGRPQIRKT